MLNVVQITPPTAALKLHYETKDWLIRCLFFDLFAVCRTTSCVLVYGDGNITPRHNSLLYMFQPDGFKLSVLLTFYMEKKS